MRSSWLVTAGVCAWLVACGGSSHRKALTCDAALCGPDEAGAAGMADETGGGPSAGGKDAGAVDHEPDASLDAGAGGIASEAGAAGAGSESELHLVIVGKGTVAVSNEPACLASPCSYATSAGSTFALQAKASADSRFVAWSGDCAGNKPNISVAVNGVRECTATFVVQRAVAAAVTGDGGGSVLSDPDLSCNADGCSGAVDDDTSVTLTATAQAGYGFVKWTGSAACNGKTQASISVKVTADLSCNASFAKQFKVSVSAAGASAQVGVASGACDALLCSVNALGSASFHAEKEPAGFRFSGWSGDPACTGTATPLLVTSITGDLSCVANYKARLSATGLVAAGFTGAVEASSADVNAVCKDNSCTLDAGSVATLKAPTIAGSRLTGWSGAGCLSANQSGAGITVTPTAGNVTCTANYAAGVSVSGTVLGATGTVTAASTSAGASCSPGTCGIDSGGSVTLSAPNLLPSYRFSGWSGDPGCSGATAQITLGNVTSSKTCNANYVQQFTIASVAGTGGTVSAKNGAAACTGNSCTVDVGTAVTLQAFPDTANGYHFTGWSGVNCSATDNPLTLKNLNTTCTAAFALDTFTISAVSSTTGTVTATRGDSNAQCAGASCTVNYGVNVSLAAVPNANFHFVAWSGAGCAPTGSNPLGLKNVNATCNASFTGNTFAATTRATPTGGGTATTTCQNDCGTVPYNQTVNISAVANPGWSFVGWSANCGGGTAVSKSLNITANIECVASFQPYATAATSPSGSGQITATGTAAACTGGDPASCLVDPSGAGGSVTFVAKPATANQIFTGWSGDCMGSAPSVTLTGIQTPKACTANFYSLWAQASGIKGTDQMTHVTPLADGTVIGLGETTPGKVRLMSLLTLDANTGKLSKNLFFTAAANQDLTALGLATDAAQKTTIALGLHAGVNQPYVYTEAWSWEYAYSTGSAALATGGALISAAKNDGYAFTIAVQDAPNAAGLPAIPAGHLTKLDSKGNVTWDVQFCAQNTTKPVTCYATQPVALAQDPETQNYAVLSQVSLAPVAVGLTFISASGELLGSTFYAERTGLVPAQLVRAAKDTYLVVGSRLNGNGVGSAFYAELGLAGGAPRFAFGLGSTATNPQLTSVAKTATGYGLAGSFYSDAKQPTEAWLVLIDNDGKINKQLEYGGPAAELANAISTVPNGGFVFGGTTTTWGQDNGQGNTDMWTVRVAADGAIAFDSALTPKPVFQSVNLAQAALTITNPKPDTGSVKSSATQVKANVTVKTDTTFFQVKQTP